MCPTLCADHVLIWRAAGSVRSIYMIVLTLTRRVILAIVIAIAIAIALATVRVRIHVRSAGRLAGTAAAAAGRVPAATGRCLMLRAVNSAIA